ncbi:MAG: hypothetical protein ACI8UR_002430 [Natronomonas sp.]|uniref:DUF309 domain-containing protein n=1 Tax=Natronomonas sp. TaxID=2184060 RepID=UPI003989B916
MNHLRAGIALFNAGHYLAAHEPWEELWLDAPTGERDDCIQGLVQATAATHKARTGNWSGAVGLAESAAEYLAACDGALEVTPLITWLRRLASDPELAERERPPILRPDGETVTVKHVQFPTAAIAADALAETRGDETVEQAVEYAIADIEADDETSDFVMLTLAYLRDDSPAVRQRIADHVDRRRMRESDVEGLFE